MDCGKANDRCATTGLVFTASQETTKMFTKVCSTKVACDNSGTVFLKACQVVTGKMCEYKCCDKDLCNNVNNVNNDTNVNNVNNGDAPMVSILLMVVCTVVGFFR